MFRGCLDAVSGPARVWNTPTTGIASLYVSNAFSVPVSGLRNDDQFFAFRSRPFPVGVACQSSGIGPGQCHGIIDSLEFEEFAERSFLADIRSDDVRQPDGRVLERRGFDCLVIENGELDLPGD